MADYKILCPACAAVLSSKKPIPNGKKITCPNCHKPFVAATSGPNTSSESGSLEFEFSPTGAAASLSPKHEPGKSALKPEKSRTPAKSGSKRLVLVGLVFLLVGLAAAGGALGVYFAMKPPDSPVVQKSKEKKSDSKVDAKQASLAQNKAKTTSPANSKDEKASKGARPAAAKFDPKSEPGANLATAADVKSKTVVAPAKVVKRIADWKEFKSATGGFTVQFPSPPDEMKERDEDIIFYETRSGLNDINYEITFHRLKKDELKVPIKDRFTSFAEQYKATTKDKKEITLSGQPALELMLVDDKTRAFERWTVYKEHVFHIAVSGNKDTLGPDQVTRFLDSFQFVADPQGRFLDITESTTIPEKKK